MALLQTTAPLEVEELDGSRRQVTLDELRGENGPPGPAGPEGPASLPPTVFTQSSPSAAWDIVHNLESFPAVHIVDSAGTVVLGEIHYDSPNELTLRFSSPFSGKAYLTR